MIDLDQLIPGSAFFRWREALWLDKWKLWAYPPPDVYANIIKCAKYVADPLRNYLGLPMVIDSWWRPPAYNQFIGGASDSQHVMGLAIDFRIPIMTPDQIRAKLINRLDSMGVRMELETPTWVHVDMKQIGPGESRTFKPSVLK
jgi:hypothetical protein